ncbi:PAS domain S-box protein [uncultured Draconibacterium sp.]|uniref:PAS domain S-box protein n=1 Tax=uncultured Draconibacterium sp. TaxID=1573823 RepID=UPI0032164524
MNSVDLYTENEEAYSFEDFFDIEEIQRMQDLFADVNEVASIITQPDGTPLTRPSNFTRLCAEIIRRSPKGRLKCFRSDSVIGECNTSSSTAHKCLSAGLWDAGVTIKIGDFHVANWLIGQVKSTELQKEELEKYADEIDIDRTVFIDAYKEIPIMSENKFNKIAELLAAFVTEITDKAYKNILVQKEISEKEVILHQKKEKEQELKETYDEFRLISENVPTIIWKAEITSDGRFVNSYISEIADELLELPKGTIKNDFEKYFSYVVPEDLALLNKTIAEAKSNPGKTYSESYNVKKDNGELAIFESTGRIHKLNNKMLFIGTTADITAQRKIKTRLQEDEYVMKQAQKVTNFGYYVLDVVTGFWVSSSFLDYIFGIDDSYEKDVSGWLDFIHPDDRKMMEEYFYSEILEKHKNFNKQYRIIKANSDEVVWVHGMGELEMNEEGNVVKMIGTIQDITKRKEMDDLLLESEERYQSLLSNLPVGVFRSSLKGEVLSANQAMAEMYGYETVEELLQVPAEEYYAESNPRDLMLEKLLADGYLLDYETQEHKKDGSLIWVSANYKLVKNTNDGNYYIEGVLIDVSDRKRANIKLEESERLLAKITDNFPNSYISIIEKDYTIGYSGGQEFIKQGIDPKSFYGCTLHQVFDEKAGFVRDFYEKTFNGEECNFELFINNQFQKYKTVPLYSSASEIDRILVVTENITDQKEKEIEILEAKAKAEESTERYELAMQVTHDGPYDWNLITNQIYYSDRWKEIVGYKPDELQNDFSVWEQLTNPEDVKRSWELLNRHIKGEVDKFEIEFQMKHKDGHWVDILSRARAQFDKTGKAIRVVGTHIDITESKKAEKHLRENEERFRKLTEHLPSGIAIYLPLEGGRDFRIIDINKTAEVITNSTREKLVGKTFLNAFPNMEGTPLYKALKKVSKTGIDEFIPSFYYKDSIREGWRENFVYKLQTGEIVAIFRDTTGIKKAEENLIKQNRELENAKAIAEQNQARFKALHDASFGGIAIHDKGKILDCNRGLTKLTGLKQKELIGMDGLLLIAKSHRKFVMKKILDEYAKPYEAVGVRKNGEEYPVRLEGRMIPYNGKRVRVVEFRDITDIKRAEHDLISAKEKAEESDRLKTAFLANMSHEIRTPMNGILGFTSLLQEPGLSGEQQQNYIDIIQKSGDRMLQTVNDIIEVSKIETGQVSVAQTKVNVSTLLEYLYNFFRAETDRKGLMLLLENQLPSSESEILTDENKLNSILSNLIKNAIKYSDTGLIKISCTKENKHIKFSVADQGIGIPIHRQKAIFDRFVQADIEDKRGHEGSGLGLTITRSYAKMLGGGVWLESREGIGSTFYATIEYKPFSKKEKTLINKTNGIKTMVEDKKHIQILVAEDDDVSFMLLENILSSENYTLTQAKNGKEVIKAFKQNPSFKLILMDIKMPELDGIEATKRIREFNETVPIIAQTAYALEGDREKALEAGCNAYVSKPINKNDLLQKIQSLL